MDIEIEEILKFYNEELSVVNLEVRLLKTLHESQEWNKLNDREKQDLRIKKNKFNTINGLGIQYQKIFEYEKSVIELIDYIIDFISKADVNFINAKAIRESDELKSFFRLRNMLFCEKEFVNRLPEIKNVGHVPYEVVKPIIEALRKTEFYLEYNLLILDNLYGNVDNLYQQNPYSLR